MSFSARLLSDKEWFPLESFLWLDPLVGLTTAIAARCWNVALWGTLAVLLVCLFYPRGFCGYVCPLGTLIDLFDWGGGRVGNLSQTKHTFPTKPSAETPGSVKDGASLTERARRVANLPHTKRRQFANLSHTRWRDLRYGVLVLVLVSSLFGVLLSGFVAALPVVTRGLLFTAGRLQLGLLKSWSEVGPANGGLYVSVALFAAIFVLGLFGRRFWCRWLCPTGATFSIFNSLRLRERQLDETKCIQCGRCVEACSFDAINDDFTTRPLDCTFCKTCGGACPTGAIQFAFRVGQVGNLSQTKRPVASGQACSSPDAGAERALPEQQSGQVRNRSCTSWRQVANLSYSRRGFILSAASGAAIAVAARAGLADGFRAPRKLLRPPGSVPESAFLDLCIRCGECFKVCPGPVLHPAGFEAGFEALWTPVVVATHAGCHQDCNFCTQVCPTRAIRPLAIEQKRKTRMGLAAINPKLCLPHRGERDCRLCFDECEAAGYHAIAMREIRLDVGKIPEGVFSDEELEKMGRIQAPFVVRDACVGCGLCEYRCHTALVKQEKALPERAVVVVPENEDRLL